MKSTPDHAKSIIVDFFAGQCLVTSENPKSAIFTPFNWLETPLSSAKKTSRRGTIIQALHRNDLLILLAGCNERQHQKCEAWPGIWWATFSWMECTRKFPASVLAFYCPAAGATSQGSAPPPSKSSKSGRMGCILKSPTLAGAMASARSSRSL